MTIALTGGTGFVGGRVLALATERGLAVRALARGPQPERDGVTWVPGALDDPDGLARLVEGASAVVHVAGVTNAATRDGYVAGNVAGTAATVRAAEAAGVRRFVHVSSIAAREPQLSDYCRTKRDGEDLVAASALDWTVVRPPAVFGPGEHEMVDLFRAARLGMVPLPASGRLSLIAADDLARLLLDALHRPDTIGRIYEPDDGTPGGWTHAGFARAIGRALGRRVLPLPMPAALVRAGARADQLARGGAAKLTPDRAAYLLHPDWVCDPALRPPADVWRPEIETVAGLRATADWYRAAGLL